MIKYCPNCKNILSEEDEICSSCSTNYEIFEDLDYPKLYNHALFNYDIRKSL